jgi:hypothetical protein
LLEDLACHVDAEDSMCQLWASHVCSVLAHLHALATALVCVCVGCVCVCVCERERERERV